MSENRNRGPRDFSKYDSMATEELEEILRLDADAPMEQESDTELLLYVMGVLANRRNNTNRTGKTALEAWEFFQQHYLSDEEERHEDTPDSKPVKHVNPWLRRLAAAAAAIALVVFIPLSASAFGWEGIWNIFARWAKETFSFVSDESALIRQPSPVDEEDYVSLQAVLEDNNRSADMIPSWIPDGYVLERIEKDITPAQEIYWAFYLDGEKELTIRVQTYMFTDIQNIEIEQDYIEVYTRSGIEYYIFSNVDQIQVIWAVDSYECTISGDLSLDEAKKMIDSIEKGYVPYV